jgi:hypothetical protein
MAEKRQLEFFLLRYVPSAVRQEFVNIGVLMVEPGANGSVFADVRFAKDWRRVQCLDPQADVEVLEATLGEIRAEMGEIRERAQLFRRMEDSFSNLIQLSPASACLAEDATREIETVASMFVDETKVVATRMLTGRQRILGAMRDAWEQAGVAESLRPVPVAPYTRPGDPFAFDFGYRVGGEMKLFHAVSLKAGVETAVTLAARYPKIALVMGQITGTAPMLTAVVEAELDRAQAEVGFALEMMEESKIRVAPATEMPRIAEMARVELRV